MNLTPILSYDDVDLDTQTSFTTEITNEDTLSASPDNVKEPTTINLVDLTPFTAVHREITFGHEFEASLRKFDRARDSDNMGNSDYETGYRFVTTRHTIREYTYILDRKFDYFKGMIAVSLGSKDSVQSGYFMIFTVYGDGEKLYKSEELRGGVRPIPFNIVIWRG